LEIERFLDNFTINYSYFFRNYEIFKRIGELLEKYQLTKNSLIKVWSCPCANGEEPYSLGILFEELKAENSDFPEYKIVASDINSQAIKKAKKGIYGKHALHEIPP
jgi:chemotaxis protein methyltransferase CheR